MHHRTGKVDKGQVYYMDAKKYKGKLLLTRYKNKTLLLHLKDNRLILAQAFSENSSILGNVYLGKVTNVVKNIDAAFVEIMPGQICFLPLKECRHALLANRSFDNRILPGDEMVVQVVKEASKTKQPSVSANISFTGTYCVVTTGKRNIGFSSKLKTPEREELQKYLHLLKEQSRKEQTINSPVFVKELGYVFRTNCRELHGNYEPLFKELKDLNQKAEKLLQTAIHRTCYSLLSEAEAPYLSAVSSIYQNEYEEIVTDSEALFQSLLASNRFPASKLRLYQDSRLTLQKLYAVETKLSEALSKKVWLKSGGFLVIEPTEALTVIDVNTGKSIGKQPSKEHYFKTNMEAAGEIALQLKLRNISGIVIIDFINMEELDKEEELLAYLKELLKKDAVKTDVVDITPLGLVEITRQKISRPLWEQL